LSIQCCQHRFPLREEWSVLTPPSLASLMLLGLRMVGGGAKGVRCESLLVECLGRRPVSSTQTPSQSQCSCWWRHRRRAFGHTHTTQAAAQQAFPLISRFDLIDRHTYTHKRTHIQVQGVARGGTRGGCLPPIGVDRRERGKRRQRGGCVSSVVSVGGGIHVQAACCLQALRVVTGGAAGIGTAGNVTACYARMVVASCPSFVQPCFGPDAPRSPTTTLKSQGTSRDQNISRAAAGGNQASNQAIDRSGQACRRRRSTASWARSTRARAPPSSSCTTTGGNKERWALHN
jgi:hypothetical protein